MASEALSTPPDISVVVPVRNGAGRIGPLHRRLTTATAGGPDTFEVVFVDDGSTDDTWRVVARLAHEDPQVVGLRLERSVGQTGALCAGFAEARGAIVISMDDDLEIDPRRLDRFVTAIRNGAEFASGKRVGPRPLGRAACSWLFNARLRSWGVPFEDAGCGFNAMTQDLARQIAGIGWAARQHRCKYEIARLTDRWVDVAVEVEMVDSSHYSLLSLGASWLDVELAIGGLTRATYCGVGVVAPNLGAWLWRRAVADGGSRSRLLGTAATVAGVGASALALRMLQLRERVELRARSEPPFTIVERAPRASGPGAGVPPGLELGR